VLRAIELVGVHVFASASLERETESTSVEGTSCFGVSNNRGDARNELNVHPAFTSVKRLRSILDAEPLVKIP